jgi:hypothetical protein
VEGVEHGRQLPEQRGARLANACRFSLAKAQKTKNEGRERLAAARQKTKNRAFGALAACEGEKERNNGLPKSPART